MHLIEDGELASARITLPQVIAKIRRVSLIRFAI